MKGIGSPVQVQMLEKRDKPTTWGVRDSLPGCGHPQHGSLDVTSLGQVSKHKVTLLFAMATYLSGQLACHQQNVTQFPKAECRIFISTSNDQNVQEGSVQNLKTVCL